MSTDQELSSIERTLLEDPHVVSIDKLGNYEIPEIDFSLWKEGSGAQRYVNWLCGYLERPITVDNFGLDHSSRRRWESTLSDGVKEYLDRNPLGANTTDVVCDRVESLSDDYIGTDPDKLSEFYDEMLSLLPNDYSEVPVEEKVRLVRDIKKKVHEVLKFLSEQKLT